MTSNTLSLTFTEVYPEIRDFALRQISYRSSQHDLSALLAECYLHLEKHKHELVDSSTVKAYSKQWIKFSLQYAGSPFSRSQRFPLDEPLERASLDPLPDIEARISQWASTLPTREARLWEMYWVKGLTKGLQLANHLQVSPSTGYGLRRECKALELALYNHLKDQLI